MCVVSAGIGSILSQGGDEETYVPRTERLSNVTSIDTARMQHQTDTKEEHET